MKLICALNDKVLLGLDGMSARAPRRTARAIVKTSDERYAVMYAQKFNLYSLPGGGVEPGEDILAALKREIYEETGCTCDQIEELGYVYENRAHQDFTSESHYFIVTCKHAAASIHLTDSEIANKTSVQWHPFEKIVHLICDPVHTTTQRMYIQARDKAALEAYMEQNI